jgi:phosphoenolpyruvate carboxylase
MKNDPMLQLSLLAALSIACILPFAHAQSALLTHQRVADIVAQQQQLRSKVQREKSGWDAIPKDKRDELLTRQQRLLDLLSGKDTVGDLSPPDQVEVANTLEWINALANNAEDERQVCRRERKTGSHQVTTICQTVADMNAQRERTKETMRVGERLNSTPPPSGAQK